MSYSYQGQQPKPQGHIPSPQYSREQHMPQQRHVQQQRPQPQGSAIPPYPVQPYPGFVNHQNQNFSTDSITRRIGNRDETPLAGQSTQNTSSDIINGNSFEPQGMKSMNSLLSGSSDGSREAYQQHVPHIVPHQQTQPPIQNMQQHILRTNTQVPLQDAHRQGQMQQQSQPYQQQQGYAPQNPIPMGQQRRPPQSAPQVQGLRQPQSASQQGYQPQERKASGVSQTPSTQQPPATISIPEQTPFERFTDLRLKACAPSSLRNPAIQVEWIKILLELSTDRDFVAKYSVTGESMPLAASASEIKKNVHNFIKLAVKTLKKVCSDTEYREAQFILGSLYSNSPTITVPKPDILERSFEKAFSYYTKAGNQGHPLSLYRLGVSFELGIGTAVNEQRALDSFTRGAAAGSVPAMFKLGVIYSKGGLGTRRSAAKMMEWLHKAASNASVENPHALFELSKIMNRDFVFILQPSPSDVEFLKELDRIGVSRNEEASLHYCKEAARLMYSPGQFKLGWCYEYGKLGCSIDAKRSIGWYSRAAKQGNAEAEMALSGWYLTGAKPILEPNDREAFLWAMKSAESGFVKAEYALGYYYEAGLGCERDLEMARKFYQRAATQGHEKAIDKLRAMRMKRDKR